MALEGHVVMKLRSRSSSNDKVHAPTPCIHVSLAHLF